MEKWAIRQVFFFGQFESKLSFRVIILMKHRNTKLRLRRHCLKAWFYFCDSIFHADDSLTQQPIIIHWLPSIWNSGFEFDVNIEASVFRVLVYATRTCLSFALQNVHTYSFNLPYFWHNADDFLRRIRVQRFFMFFIMLGYRWFCHCRWDILLFLFYCLFKYLS
jgi:hypothetical protein